MSRVYLDHNATTPLRVQARAAMVAAMDVVGNPSSVHAEGRAAKMLVERHHQRSCTLPDEVPGREEDASIRTDSEIGNNLYG